jgi:glycosyltransferase involved in cell wall biosynthesis
MKICMFTNTYLPHVGGVARSVHFFTEDLRARGHQVLVVAPIFSEDVDDEREDEVLRVPAIQNFNGSDFSVRITLPFIISNKINEFQPDLIHSHHPFLLGDAALRTARRQECPLVFTHHTLYERYTHYVPFDSEGLQRFVIHLSTRYANLCCGVVAPSRSIVDLLRERGVTTAIREIPTGVDLAFFESGRGGRFRSAHKIPEGKPVVGHVGRLAPEKNLGYLARAVAEILKKNDGYFLVVGKGPSREEIEGIFETEGLSSRLCVAGEQTGRELADAYRAMDVFAFASKTETQGMVLVEAMAAGNPVIALDASGVREVVRDGRNGRLLKGDAQEVVFAQALEDFFNDFNKAAAWREEALETARRFSREECANRLLHFYEQLLEKDTRKVAEPAEPNEEILSWEKLLRSLKVEWDLIAQKAGALTEAFNED